MVDDGIAYVRLTRFTRNCASEVEQAILELTDENELKGLVLDLRGNPGGLLNESVSLCNLFIDKNEEVVSTKGKIKDWEKSYKTMKEPLDKDLYRLHYKYHSDFQVYPLRFLFPIFFLD